MKSLINISIYGAGGTGRSILAQLRKENPAANYIFCDSDSRLWGTEVDGVPVIDPGKIPEHEFERIYVGAVMAREDIRSYLVDELNIPQEKVIVDNMIVKSYLDSYDVRIRFLRMFSEIVYDRKLSGNTAEGGVYNGAFSKYITKYFFDRKHYMFDTFEGFDESDAKIDGELGYSKARNSLYSSSKSISDIVNSLEHPENAIVRKGVFSDTAEGINDDFVFVHLDFDLYQPTIAGLRYFYPKMVKGGVILVHDYDNPSCILPSERYLGIRAAALEFCDETGIDYMPIGDEMSIAFIKR